MKTTIKKIGEFLSKTTRNVLLKRTKTIRNYQLYSTYLKEKNGLEIGGPSDIFKKGGLVPVYTVAHNLDGCNFNTTTVWEGRIEEGPNRYLFYSRKSKGYQYIKDAVDLTGINNENYDFILSSHSIEHIANPFKALSEWLRVLKTGGLLLLVTPHKDGTFDHNRPITQLQHLIDDFDRSVTEGDMTHLPEILELHDLSLDPPAGDLPSFRQRSMKNYENRCLHHHVFDANLVARMIHHFKLQILDIQLVLPFHIILLAQKISKDNSPDNSVFLAKATEDTLNGLILYDNRHKHS